LGSIGASLVREIGSETWARELNRSKVGGSVAREEINREGFERGTINLEGNWVWVGEEKIWLAGWRPSWQQLRQLTTTVVTAPCGVLPKAKIPRMNGGDSFVLGRFAVAAVVFVPQIFWSVHHISVACVSLLN
jgi:hypothetical protein